MIGDRLENDVRPARLQGWKTIRILQGFARQRALMHDLAVLRKQARQTRSFARLGPRRACVVAFERTLR